ncbi:hypothetical protein LZ198_24435 [Myxococcus sp. K15C18031901]|uniref:COG1470 family protein n=1 Tax=Myxococcus dinghuensis TaxID=2906761 RepID=UPI0020A77D2E|nr:hypothetical protein [Myxococcus dinghuensis]MCP3102019.1 hypothetical protein [Myxococcus dinghuensis]
MTHALRRSLFLLGCLLAAAGCSDSPYYRVEVTTPDTITLLPGESSTFDITVARVGEVPGQVTLSLENAPEGVTLTPEVVLPSGQDSVTVPVTLSADANVPFRGMEDLLLLARDTGKEYASGYTLFAVVHDPPTAQPDFSISVEPRQVDVYAGGEGATVVTVTRAEGFAGPLTFSIESPTKRITAEPVTMLADRTTRQFLINTDRSATRLPAAVRVIATTEDGRTATTGLTVNVR